MSKYYCSKCKKNHIRGKIYKDHLKYQEKIVKKSKTNCNKKDQKKRKIPIDKVIEYNYNKLRPLAQRQIDRLLKKLHNTENYQLYIYQINKLIIHEQS
ncbi:MAG: hypothetical protein JW891_13760 [Candidatus Lokiarchaeota archaeon]|nr:hypothetical protein [Candidatus Lokiarchaeota archaeon]